MGQADDAGASNRLPFMGPDGVRWTVRELIGDRSDPPCLVFECDSMVRRVRAYPANWGSLDGDALFALSWKV